MTTLDTPARIATVVISLLEMVIPLLTEREQVTALDRIAAWTQRRRKTIAKHQQRLDARKGLTR